MGGEENERLKWKLEERKCVCVGRSLHFPQPQSQRAERNSMSASFSLFFEICGNAVPLSRIHMFAAKNKKTFGKPTNQSEFYFLPFTASRALDLKSEGRGRRKEISSFTVLLPPVLEKRSRGPIFPLSNVPFPPPPFFIRIVDVGGCIVSFFPSFANWKRNFQFRDLPSLHSCAAVAGIMAPPHVCCKSQLEGQRSATLRGLPSLASCHPHSFCMLQRMKLWANANEILSRSSSSAFPSPYLKPRRQAGEQCPSSAPLLTEQTNSVF